MRFFTADGTFGRKVYEAAVNCEVLSCAMTTYWFVVAREISVTELHAAPAAQERCVLVRFLAIDMEFLKLETLLK